MSDTSLYWNGETLLGETASRRVKVELPARLVAFASFHLPAADATALRAAISLRARRHFAALMPARLEALIGSPLDGRCPVLAMALPQAQIDALLAVAHERQLRVSHLRIAELSQPADAEGLVRSHGEACLLQGDAAGNLCAVTVLGPIAAPDFAERCSRARRDHAPAEPLATSAAATIDFLNPGLSRSESFWARRQTRIAGLIAALLLLLLGGGLLMLNDLAREHADLTQQLAARRPEADLLRSYRQEGRELATWFGQRPSAMPALSALEAALAVHNGTAQVYLTRFRQHSSTSHSAEGVAVGREAMMAFVERLRAQPGVKQVEIKNLSGSGAEGARLAFELSIELEGGAHAAS